jgi:hypothetical protein
MKESDTTSVADDEPVLSGPAIAGIVIGALACLILVCLGFRLRMKSKER